jgi:hypothetical protein
MLKAVTTGDSSRQAITQIEESMSGSKRGLRQKPSIPRLRPPAPGSSRPLGLVLGAAAASRQLAAA